MCMKRIKDWQRTCTYQQHRRPQSGCSVIKLETYYTIYGAMQFRWGIFRAQKAKSHNNFLFLSRSMQFARRLRKIVYAIKRVFPISRRKSKWNAKRSWIEFDPLTRTDAPAWWMPSWRHASRLDRSWCQQTTGKKRESIWVHVWIVQCVRKVGIDSWQPTN